MRWEANTAFAELLLRAATIDAILTRLDAHAAAMTPSTPLRAPIFPFAQRSKLFHVKQSDATLFHVKHSGATKPLRKEARQAEQRSMVLLFEGQSETRIGARSQRGLAHHATSSLAGRPIAQLTNRSLAIFNPLAPKHEAPSVRTPLASTASTPTERRVTLHAHSPSRTDEARRKIIPLFAWRPAGEFSRSPARESSPDVSDARWENTNLKLDQLGRDVRRLTERKPTPPEFQ